MVRATASKQKLTKTLIDGLQPQADGKAKIYWDTEVTNFGVKVLPSGAKKYLVRFRPKGHTSRAIQTYTIGNYDELTLAQARDKARDVRTDARQQKHTGQLEKAEARKAAKSVVSDLISAFLTERGTQNKSIKETIRIMTYDVLPAIGKRSVHELTKHDILSVIEKVFKRGSPIMANRTLATVRSFLNWCVNRGILEHSPAYGIKAFAKETPRDRTLNEEEIKAVLLAAREMTYPFGPIVELLFYTGQRRGEVAGIRWDEIDFKARLWKLPKERTKNKRPHTIHLCDSAIELLEKQSLIMREDGLESPFVFTKTGKTASSGFSKSKLEIDKLSRVPNWSWHDIRRTVATEMSKLGIPIHVVEAILNHKSGTVSGIVAVYQQNQFDEERQQAMTRWCHKLAAIVAGETVPVSPST